MNRILEVHKPTGYHGGEWPYCVSCKEGWPCQDALRVMEAVK